MKKWKFHNNIRIHYNNDHLKKKSINASKSAITSQIPISQFAIIRLEKHTKVHTQKAWQY